MLFLYPPPVALLLSLCIEFLIHGEKYTISPAEYIITSGKTCLLGIIVRYYAVLYCALLYMLYILYIIECILH